MKILLQNKENSLFFKRLDMWTSSHQEAFDFKQARIAMDFASLYSLDNTRILVVTVTHNRRVQMLPFDLPGAEAAELTAESVSPELPKLHAALMESSLHPAGSVAAHAAH